MQGADERRAGDIHTDEVLPLERAYYWEATDSRRAFLTQPMNGRQLHWAWGEAMDEARRVATYLVNRHWEPNSRIVILSRNCAWWVMAELAIWMAGHATVPIYTSLTLEAARRLIQHCGPMACFLGALDNSDLASCAQENGIEYIRFPNATPGDSSDWSSLLACNKPIVGNPVRRSNDLATIIYTSGTTGAPKGVMHRFAAFPYFVKAVQQTVGSRRQRVFSYLPLAHIAERALSETSAVYGGWQIYFCESAATFMTDLKRARPTVFFSVPRLYTKFQQKVLEKLPPEKLDQLLAMPVVNHFVKRRILKALGLSSVRFAASGSAPISNDLVRWFRRLGLPLTEGYGTTETGITHTAPNGASRVGYVGRSTPGVETTISADKEVLLRSPMGMLGYYNDPAATRDVRAADGMIRTGDLGEVDDNGWLRLKGRMKDEFKTSKGKYVSPSIIETMLNEFPAIESCLVMGSGLPAPFGIAVLTDEARDSARHQQQREELEHSFGQAVDASNARLESHEQLMFLVLVGSKWTIEKGFVTPTLKLRRAALESHYAPFVSKWMARNEKIVWHEEA